MYMRNKSMYDELRNSYPHPILPGWLHAHEDTNVFVEIFNNI